jgi:hypothetical protein
MEVSMSTDSDDLDGLLTDDPSSTAGNSDAANGEAPELDLTPPQGVSLDDLPEEARPLVQKRMQEIEKGMKAAYTRKRQQETAQLKALGEKGQILDSLVSNPRIVAAIEAERRTLLNQQSSAGNLEEEEDPSLIQAMDRRLSPLRQELQQLKAEQAAAKFVADHPKWELYKDDMSELLRTRPTLQLEDAYKMAVGARALARQAEKNKPPSVVETTGSTPPTRPTSSEKPAGTMEEAYERALKKSGHRFRED